MNSKLSVGLLLATLDPTTQSSAYKAIGNRALGQAIFAAQRLVRNEQAEEDPTLDRRNSEDEANREERTAPLGLENRSNPIDDLRKQAEIYVAAVAKCEQYKTSDFDLPQDVDSRVEWMLTRAHDALGSRPQSLTTVADKLAFAAKVSTAKNDFDFWQKNHAKVAEKVRAAIEEAEGWVGGEASDDPIDFIDGVEAHQMAITAGAGLQSDMARLEMNLVKFKKGTTLHALLTSNHNALSLDIKPIKDLVLRLEEAYAGEIMAAIKAGRNLLSSEAIDAAHDNAVDRMVDKAFRTQATATSQT